MWRGLEEVLLGSRSESYTLAAGADPRFRQGGERESREGLRGLVSAKANSCGQTVVKSAVGPSSCVGSVSAVVKAAGIFCRAGRSKSLSHLLRG